MWVWVWGFGLRAVPSIRALPRVCPVCCDAIRCSDGKLRVVDYKTGKVPDLKYPEATNKRIMDDNFFQLQVCTAAAQGGNIYTRGRSFGPHATRAWRAFFFGGGGSTISPSPLALSLVSCLKGARRACFFVPRFRAPVCCRPLPRRLLARFYLRLSTKGAGKRAAFVWRD